MKSKDFLAENLVDDAHEMHIDHEVQMARSECYHAAESAIALHKMLRNVSEHQGLDGWVSAKITLANDYLKTVHEYLEYKLMTMNSDVSQLPMAESKESESKFTVKYFNPKIDRDVTTTMKAQNEGVVWDKCAKKGLDVVSVTKKPIAEGSTSKEKQKTPYRDINSPEYRAAAEKQKEKIAQNKAAEPGKNLLSKIRKKGVMEGAKSHSELAKLAYEAYIQAVRSGNSLMANHYKQAYEKHKRLAASERKSVTKGVAEGSETECPRCHSTDIKTYSDGEKECHHCHKTWDAKGVSKTDYSPMTKDAMKADKIRSLKNLIAKYKEQGRQLKVQELELELKKLQGVAEGLAAHSGIEFPIDLIKNKVKQGIWKTNDTVLLGADIEVNNGKRTFLVRVVPTYHETHPENAGFQSNDIASSMKYDTKFHESASAGASGTGSIASVTNPDGKPKSKVGTLFGGTYHSEDTDKPVGKPTRIKKV